MLEESPGIDKVRGEESVTRLSSMALRYVGRIAGAGRDGRDICDFAWFMAFLYAGKIAGMYRK